MHHLAGYLLVFLGGGLGAMLRHGVNRLGMAWLGPSFPWNTLFVNVAGGLLMGLFISVFAYRGEHFSQPMQLFLTTGILGGFTTFSAFTLDTVRLWQSGQVLVAGGYVAGSVGLAIVGLSAGRAIARALVG
jgi:fluoride exporter